MEQFKIDHYECEHGPGAFPQFRELSAEECLVLRRELCTLLALDSATKSLTLLRMLDQLAEPLNEISAEDEGFELAQIFHELKLDTGGRYFSIGIVLIEWMK